MSQSNEPTSKTPRKTERFWNKLPELYTSQNIVLASDYDALITELEQAKLELGEAQQWIDSEPDWKDKFMANYAKVKKENESLTTRNAELEKVAEEMAKTMTVIKVDFKYHNQSISNYSDRKSSPDYKTRSQLIDDALTAYQALKKES